MEIITDGNEFILSQTNIVINIINKTTKKALIMNKTTIRFCRIVMALAVLLATGSAVSQADRKSVV